MDHAASLKEDAARFLEALPSQNSGERSLYEVLRFGGSCDVDMVLNSGESENLDLFATPFLSYDSSKTLFDWLTKVDIDSLRKNLAYVPTSIGNLHFTAWQRLFICCYVWRPYSLEASISVSNHEMRTICGNDSAYERKKACLGIHESICRFKHTIPEKGIINTPPGSGKTSMSLTIGYLIAGPRFPLVLERYQKRRKAVQFCNGSLEIKVARLVLVSVSATTFGHYKDALTSMLFHYRNFETDLHLVQWNGMGKQYSVSNAAALGPNTLVFWILPVEKLNEVLRQNPEYHITCLLADEVTKNQRNKQSISPILHTIFTQATVAIFTDEKQTLLSENKVYDPRELETLIRSRYFKEASQCAVSTLKLTLLTSNEFRVPIMQDLKRLLPVGLDVFRVRSRTLTLSALVGQHTTDIVPVSLFDTLLKYFDNPRLSTTSIEALKNCVQSSFTTENLVTCLKTLQPRETYTHTGRHDTTREHHLNELVNRLTRRLQEYANECPICNNDGRHCQIFGCCGYAVCQLCFEKVNSCPFCRSPVQKTCTIVNLQDTTVDTTYAQAPEFGETTFQQALQRHTSRHATQLKNLVNVLHILKHFQYTHSLIIIKGSSYTNPEDYLDVQRMQQVTQFKIITLDRCTGQGTDFTQKKKQFDQSQGPVAILHFSDETNGNFLFGTDMATADSLLIIGDISQRVVTQSIARIFRPNPTRNNQNNLPVIRISL